MPSRDLMDKVCLGGLPEEVTLELNHQKKTLERPGGEAFPLKEQQAQSPQVWMSQA